MGLTETVLTEHVAAEHSESSAEIVSKILKNTISILLEIRIANIYTELFND